MKKEISTEKSNDAIDYGNDVIGPSVVDIFEANNAHGALPTRSSLSKTSIFEAGALGAVAITVAGCGAENPTTIVENTDNPSFGTSLPSEGPVEFTPRPETSIDPLETGIPNTGQVFPPSPEPTPSPTPEVTPNIEDVPVKGGEATAFVIAVKPYYLVSADNMTVVAKEYNKNGKLEKVALTSEGKKITKKNCETTIVGTIDGDKTIKLCEYSGATLWFHISEKTLLFDRTRGDKDIGQGQEQIDEELQIGERIPYAIITTNIANVKGYLTQKQINTNLKNWDKLKSSVGKKSRRSDQKFTFYTASISVVPNDK